MSSCRTRLLRRKLIFPKTRQINNMKPQLRLINCEKIRQQLRAKIVLDLDCLAGGLRQCVGPLKTHRSAFVDAGYPEPGDISITSCTGEIFIKVCEFETQINDSQTRFQLEVFRDLKKIKDIPAQGTIEPLGECKQLLTSELSPFELPIT